MTHTEKETYDAVMAALLNSECATDRAVVTKALEAITRFALTEGRLSRVDFAGVVGEVVLATPEDL